MSTEPGFTNADNIHFTVVPPGCSLRNSPWTNGLSRLSVVNNWDNILLANFHLSWKRGKADCTRLWKEFLNWNKLLENRLNTTSDSKCEALNEHWLELEQYCSNCLHFPVDIFVQVPPPYPPSTNISQAHLCDAVHCGTLEKNRGKVLFPIFFFIFLLFYCFSFPFFQKRYRVFFIP